MVGARPNFVKMAPILRALETYPDIQPVLIHTGQHYDASLSDVFFQELELPEPSHHLEVGSGSHATQTGRIMERFEELIFTEANADRPFDLVLVVGDVNSTLACTVVAAKANVPVAHVEAGLRSGDLGMPEERNRIEVDRLAKLLLCPDERSAGTLRAEGVAGRIEVVGDVMADACFTLAPLAARRSHALERFGVEPGGYLVCTVHREANVAQPRLGRIVEGLNRLAEPVVFPAHPRTRAAVEREGLALGPHVLLAEPLGYLDFSALCARARAILTDSGGLQKEAYWHGVPCVTLRPSTEWADTVELGANTLVDDDPNALVAAVAAARMPDHRPPLYGDGHASERVAATLVATLPLR